MHTHTSWHHCSSYPMSVPEAHLGRNPPQPTEALLAHSTPAIGLATGHRTGAEWPIQWPGRDGLWKGSLLPWVHVHVSMEDSLQQGLVLCCCRWACTMTKLVQQSSPPWSWSHSPSFLALLYMISCIDFWHTVADNEQLMFCLGIFFSYAFYWDFEILSYYDRMGFSQYIRGDSSDCCKL